ncbi:MAG: DUF2569 family protein [Sedimentisphaerales bacterium]|nr:DUF2569 family protein [Sedimentisphaerales bacterium]
MEIVSQVISWLALTINLLLLILAATRKRLRGKLFLIFFLAGNLICNIVWRTIDILIKLDKFDSFIDIYDWIRIPLLIISFISFCFLIPFVLIAPVPKTIKKEEQEIYSDQLIDSNVNPHLVGIGGWLILPAIGLILGTILSVVGLIIVFTQSEDIYDEYGGIFILNITFDIIMTILIFFATIVFFGKKSYVPTMMIYLMIFNIVICGLLLAINISQDAEIFAIEYAKGLAKGIISSFIWIPYFLVSKRVKATFVN